MSKKTRMLSGPVLPTYLRFSVPWTLSMLAAGSASIVDGLFIGRFVGSHALASINIVMPVLSILGGIGIMLATGGAAITGNYLGRGLIENASAMLCKTLISILLAAIAFCLGAWIFMKPLLVFLGADDELHAYCAQYLEALLPFSICFPLSYSLSCFVRLDGRPVLASMGYIAGAGANVILDSLFIAVLGLGLTGAGVATGLSYSLACVVLGLHFTSSRCSYIRTSKFGKWREVLKAAWNGMSEFVNETSAGIVIFLFNLILMKNMGVAGVAAFTAAGYVMMLGGLICYGFADSLAPITSVNNGAKQYARMHQFLACAASVILVLGIAMTMAVGIWAETLAMLFLPQDAEGSSLAIRFLEGMKWQFAFMGLNMMIAAYFTGRLWPVGSFTIACCRSLLLPVALVFLLPVIFGIDVIYYVISITEAVTLLIASGLFLRGIKAGRA